MFYKIITDPEIPNVLHRNFLFIYKKNDTTQMYHSFRRYYDLFKNLKNDTSYLADGLWS